MTAEVVDNVVKDMEEKEMEESPLQEASNVNKDSLQANGQAEDMED